MSGMGILGKRSPSQKKIVVTRPDALFSELQDTHRSSGTDRYFFEEERGVLVDFLQHKLFFSPLVCE